MRGIFLSLKMVITPKLLLLLTQEKPCVFIAVGASPKGLHFDGTIWRLATRLRYGSWKTVLTLNYHPDPSQPHQGWLGKRPDGLKGTRVGS